MTFPEEKNCKTNLKCHPAWVAKKSFYSRLPQMAFLLPFLSYWITSDSHLILEDFYEKELYYRTVWKTT